MAVLTGCTGEPAQSPQAGPSLDQKVAVAAETCPQTGGLDPRFQQPIDPTNPNQQLAAEAMSKLVNQARCRQGVQPLRLTAEAVRAASGHAVTMAKNNFMGHDSPVAGLETLPRRLVAEKVAHGYAAENVARVAASMLSPGENTCLIRAGEGGVAAPTYAGMARGLMDMWMGSEKHRVNIMNPQYDTVGAGIAVNPANYNCGEVMAAMVFAG